MINDTSAPSNKRGKAKTPSSAAKRSTTEQHVEPTVDPQDDNDATGAGSSLAKMLSVLDLFTPETPVWSTVSIIENLGTSRSTGYRYIKELTAAGLLSAVGNGFYMLGPRIIELDLQIRKTDPLLTASSGVMEQLVEASGHSALLCMLFRNSVLCIDERRAPLSPTKLFTRGQSRPLFRGAISKVILANLPDHRLRAMFKRRTDAIAAANLGETWPEFRQKLAQIRTDGFAQTSGEFNPDIVGIAAPIFNGENLIVGSIGIACSREEYKEVDLQRAAMIVKRAAREVTQRMANVGPGLGMAPRAVG